MTVADAAPDLARILSLDEFEPLARLAMDRASYDYIAGGSWDELSLASSVAAWRRRTLRPRVLVDVAAVTTAMTLLGRPSAMPVAISPMAFHGAAHPDGEVATARAAAAAGVPFTLSTMSSRSIEEVAAATPDATLWFQLYVQADPRRTRRLVERAAAAST
jgi:4-hydroxymandelate oxidase